MKIMFFGVPKKFEDCSGKKTAAKKSNLPFSYDRHNTCTFFSAFSHFLFWGRKCRLDKNGPQTFEGKLSFRTSAIKSRVFSYRGRRNPRFYGRVTKWFFSLEGLTLAAVNNNAISDRRSILICFENAESWVGPEPGVQNEVISYPRRENSFFFDFCSFLSKY